MVHDYAVPGLPMHRGGHSAEGGGERQDQAAPDARRKLPGLGRVAVCKDLDAKVLRFVLAE